MITVEQIQLLESRVTKAVRKIEALQDENATLRDRLSRYEKRIEELEILINEFKDSQNDIEQGILNALSQLDELEDQVTGEPETSGEVPSRNDSGTGNSSGVASAWTNSQGEPGSASSPDDGGKSSRASAPSNDQSEGLPEQHSVQSVAQDASDEVSSTAPGTASSGQNTSSQERAEDNTSVSLPSESSPSDMQRDRADETADRDSDQSDPEEEQGVELDIF